ncbi:tetratricopeptide repeat-containing glycosyltransferase family protein [Gammaproteobacteria bacterium]|nr:tetratricopeptide repeat-containing glycosyltransferase family protein [Gammaproteobacteria bacterium]
MQNSKQKKQIRSLIQSQHVKEAERLLHTLYEQDADDVEIWHLLATVNGMLGEFEASAEWSHRVIEKHPHSVDAWSNLAAALQHSANYEAALDAWQHVLQYQPASAQAQLSVAELFRKLGNKTAALQHYRKAVSLRPQAAELHYNLGTYLQELGDYEQAEACYLKALEIRPELIQAYNNLGLVFQEQCRLNESMQCFNAAINSSEARDVHNIDARQEDVSIAEVHRHRALLWLLQGDFDNGWAEYEWRHTDSMAVKPRISIPAWDGSSLERKSILVSPEQGVGDEILFASCIFDLQYLAGKVILECDPRLVPLFHRSFPDIHVRSRKQTNTPPDIEELSGVDVHISAGSLPRYLRTSLDDFPRQAFLCPDPVMVLSWHDRYRHVGKGIKVGISWRGGGTARIQRKRSTRLQQWLSIFKLEGIQFINLQYGDCTDELQQLSEDNGVTVWDWPDADPLQDLDDFAAKVSALDLVISVDNATVHMAGGLGVPVWILQTFSPEWRWLLETEDSYWYPEVRQFRQPSIGDWETVFEAVRQALIDWQVIKE